MNIFAGCIAVNNTISKKDIENIDLDILELGNARYFIMGAFEQITRSDDLKKHLGEIFGEISHYDITLESEKMLEILASEVEFGVYERVIFEGPECSFSDLLERFSETPELVCLREGNTSELFGNSQVIADFVY